MRPERKAPENRESPPTGCCFAARLNDAGAKSPGEPPGEAFYVNQGYASMRPERKAPENSALADMRRVFDALQ